MKEYYLGHSGLYGSSENPFVKIPDDAIILDYHVVEKEYDGGKWLGLFKYKIRTKTRGVRYLIPKVETEEV